ncbi:MAG: hypothetical protein HYV34_03920 [Candidatus Kerfeldbacteria bacterium]|nr:hypothetical protein [Candidatus Kerfeldbacteria bacterium]
MNAPTRSNPDHETVERIHAIYADFVQHLNILKSERREIVDAIMKRMDEQHIQELLNQLKK